MIAKIITGQISKKVVGPSILSTAYYRIIHPDYESEMIELASQQARVADGKDEKGNTQFKYEKMFEIANIDEKKAREIMENSDRPPVFNGFPVKDYEEIEQSLADNEIEGEKINVHASAVNAHAAPIETNEKKLSSGAVEKEAKKKKKTRIQVLAEKKEAAPAIEA